MTSNSAKLLSIYIHIPFCVSKCSYCDFFSIPKGCSKNAVPQEYVDCLCNEIDFRIQSINGVQIKTVYIGGGTPSLLSNSQISQIVNCLKKYSFYKNYEFTFEINPDDVNKALLLHLQEAGINRLSCGIQSFSQNVLKTVHRRADASQNYDCFSLFKEFWNKKLSIDFISGLPYETEESLISGLKVAVQNKVPHISLYSLCVEEETPLGKGILSNKIEYDQDFSDALWIKGRDFLLSQGYLQYEVSNFCLPGNECIHNMTYWTHKDYLGIGSGATGTLYEEMGQSMRYTNSKNIEEYLNYWKNKRKRSFEKIPQIIECIDKETSKFEYFMMGLRTSRGISPQEYEKIFKEKIPVATMEKIKSHCKKSPDGFYYLPQEKLIFLNSFLENL